MEALLLLTATVMANAPVTCTADELPLFDGTELGSAPLSLAETNSALITAAASGMVKM